MKRYTEDMKTEFLERAQEVGIGRAIREMGYPTYPTALEWATARGVQVEVDPIRARAKAFDDLYKSEDLLAVLKEEATRIYMDILSKPEMSFDDHKKAAEALQKITNSWLVLQGKATDIKETSTKDSSDLELMQLLMDERERNERMQRGLV
jgi:hypothetical protein